MSAIVLVTVLMPAAKIGSNADRAMFRNVVFTPFMTEFTD